MALVGSLVAWAKATLGPYGVWGLILLSFTEAIISPIPPDILLPVLATPAPGMPPDYGYAAYLGLVTTVASVLGGAVGYWVGRRFSPWVHRKFRGERLTRVEGWYKQHGEWILIVAAFTPLPFKLFTVTSGLFGMRFWPFMLAAFLGRGLRFFPEALLSARFGQQAIEWLDAGGLIVLVVLATGVAAWWVWHRRSRPEAS
ncbi:MAG: VTT domain-containing protein [Candidatus Thermoplasmatota archaeon]|nr:VTT domain-containing protein [Candidatus Thermoplasmatota archaeon]